MITKACKSILSIKKLEKEEQRKLFWTFQQTVTIQRPKPENPETTYSSGGKGTATF